LRVFDPNKLGPDGKPGTQADGQAGDLAFALQTRIDRAIAELNSVDGNTPYPANSLNSGRQAGDPWTPLMRVHPEDTVRIKIQSGATEHEHNATIHGVKWLQAGSGHGQARNSGWRNSQNDGISEQFTFKTPVNFADGFDAGGAQGNPSLDYAYTIDSSQDGWWSGTWGVMRAYEDEQADLFLMPNNDDPNPPRIDNPRDFNGICPADADIQEYTVVAVLANEVLGNPGVTIVPNDSSATMHEGAPLDPNGGTLVYNPRPTGLSNGKSGPLHDPTAALYVLAEDLAPVDPTLNACRDRGNNLGVLSPECPVQLVGNPGPLVLRAAAGECVEATLHSRLPEVMPDLAGYNTLLQMVNRDRNDPQGLTTFQNNLVRPSSYAGLHAQVVSYDVSRHDGTIVGLNPALPDAQVVGPVTLNGQGEPDAGDPITYRWYAGHLEFVPSGNNRVTIEATPVEFGGSGLIPADKIKQGQKAMVGALIIEPEGSTWDVDVGDREGATVTKADETTFRDYAVVVQKGLNQRYGDATAIENIASEGQGIPEDSHDAGQMAVNYGSEPLWFRFGIRPDAPFGRAAGAGLGDEPNAHQAYSNGLAGGDPVTPVITATAGQEVRLRVTEPTGVGRGSTLTVHGHGWQRDPYICPGSAADGLAGKCANNEVGSRAMGDNPIGFRLGQQESVTPAAPFDFVLPSAGGSDGTVGDFLFRDQASFGNLSGIWGILRVEEPAP
jgi:hypothetical protein